MLINFPKDRVEKILAFSKASKEWRSLYQQPETAIPGLWLVGDQGVYLMDNSTPGLLADGVSVRDDKAPANASAFVAYALEIDPKRLAFDEWWYNKRQAFGGDDGCCFISAKDADWWINGSPGQKLVMDLTPGYEPVLQIPKKVVDPETTVIQYQSGLRAGQSDCRQKKAATFAQGDIGRDKVNPPEFVRGYVDGYALEEKRCKTPKSKSARKRTAKI